MIEVGKTVRVCGVIFSLGGVAGPCGIMVLDYMQACTLSLGASPHVFAQATATPDYPACL